MDKHPSGQVPEATFNPSPEALRETAALQIAFGAEGIERGVDVGGYEPDSTKSSAIATGEAVLDRFAEAYGITDPTVAAEAYQRWLVSGEKPQVKK